MVKIIVPFMVLLFSTFVLCAQRNVLEPVNKENLIQKIIREFKIINENNKYGILSNSRDTIVPCEYDSITHIETGYYKVKKQDKTGVIALNLSDKEIERSIYNFQVQANKDLLFAGFITVIPCIYDKVSEQAFSFFYVSKDNKLGVINWSGSIKIPTQYDYLQELPNGAFFVKKCDKQGIMNTSGSTRIPCIYDGITEKNNGTYTVVKDTKQGILNSSGSTRIPCMYDSISEQDNGTYVVVKDNKQGIMNASGSTRIPCMYDNISEKNNGTYIVVKNKKLGIMNASGSIRIPCMYDNISEQDNGTYVVVKDNKQGIMNASGSTRIPCMYDSISEQNNGTYVVVKDRKLGIMNASGSTRILCAYENITEQPNGLFLVVKDNKRGVLNSSGSTKIPCEYDEITILPNGSFQVKQGNATQMLPLSYQIKIEKTEYTGNNDYQGNARSVQENSNTTKKRYDETSRINDTLYLVKRNGKYGISTKQGKPIIPCKYDKLYNLQDLLRPDKNSEMIPLNNKQNLKAFYIAKKENKFGLLNIKGNTVLDCIYDNISVKDEKSITVVKDNISKNIRINNL